MELQELHELFLKSTGISTDTRTIKEGQLFFALSGENFDGDKFATIAIEKGAIAAIVKFAPDIPGHFIETEDPLHTLQVLANYHRNLFKFPFVAITGSNGKTTTKELLHAVLRQKFKVAYTKGNFNNHIGVPLTLLEITDQHDIAIIEMGANHQGEIDLLCQIANPTHGVITNIGLAHLEGFGGPEGVQKGKSEMYRYLEANDGHCFVDMAQEKIVEVAPKKNRIAFGTQDQLVWAKPLQEYPLQFDLNIGEQHLSIQMNLPGFYNMQNAVTAAVVGDHFGISISKIKLALQEYVSSNNRSQSIDWNGNQVLLDAYNANPSSVSEALKLFAKIDHPQKVIVLGEMKELGDGSDEEHRLTVELAKELNFEKIILVGENFAPYSTQVNAYYNTVDDLSADHALDISDAYILIKGSRSVGLEKIVEAD